MFFTFSVKLFFFFLLLELFGTRERVPQRWKNIWVSIFVQLEVFIEYAKLIPKVNYWPRGFYVRIGGPKISASSGKKSEILPHGH